jgi:hypothetical protein
MLRQIVVEVETPGDSRTMFRLRIDANMIAEGLTAAQAHLLVGEILERIALPRSGGESQEVPAARSQSGERGRGARPSPSLRNAVARLRSKALVRLLSVSPRGDNAERAASR